MGRFSKTTTKAQRAEMERLKQENAQLRQELAAANQESLERLFAAATLMVERDHARLELAQTKQERDQAILERDQALVDRNAMLDHLDALA
jgi:cell shape-determining protein MreC